MSKVFLVSKEDKNIKSNSPNDFYINSNYPLLKVSTSGSFTTNILGKATITHNLGYKPYAMVFAQFVDDNAGSPDISDEYYQLDWEIEGATVSFFGRAKIYDNEIQVEVGNTNAAIPGAVDGFYYIFEQEAEV